MTEIAIHEWDHALVAGKFLVLRQRLQHDEARPPVIIRRGADHAVGGLVLERPIYVALRLRFQARTVEQPRQGNESIEKVGTAFPRLALAAQPAAVRPHIGPGFVEMAAETVGL